MIPEGSFCLRVGHGKSIFTHGNNYRFINMNPYKRQQDSKFVTMGPVVASLAMYATRRMLTRLVAGQILRKGVHRKIRRLGSMFMEHHVLIDICNELVEDLLDFLLFPMQ